MDAHSDSEAAVRVGLGCLRPGKCQEALSLHMPLAYVRRYFSPRVGVLTPTVST